MPIANSVPCRTKSGAVTEKAHILVVDDESEMRGFLRDGLEAEGYAVTEAGTGDEAMTALERGGVDLITLDLCLGSEDALPLARRIRAVRNIPIIMVTGKAAPFDRVSGLESGADDYIIKPFLTRELVMRIAAVLRRYDLEAQVRTGGAAPRITGPERLVFEQTVLDMKARAARRMDGTPIDLTETEFKILELLVRNPERVLSRDEIWHELKGREWMPLDRTIDGHVARLRRKIEPPGEAPTMIRSVRGVGYVFAGRTNSGAPGI